jgi:putative PIN family toxin of toxin-antitoxin system
VTDRLRAVLDTNVFVSALLSRNPTSPTKELIERWKVGEFTLLVSFALLEELVGKLLEKDVDPDRVTDLATSIISLAEWVDVPPSAVRPVIVGDADDDHVVACAILGKADYLVTYDPHFDQLGGSYASFQITKALPFLWAVRGDRPPGEL